MKKIIKIFDRYSFLFIISIFVIVNLWFNYNSYWKVILDRSKTMIGIGEVQQSEWGMEKIYQKLLHKENPFSPIKEILYPFGLDIVASDPGMAFYFILFRPFFSTHQTLLLIVVIGILFANIGMYLLIRKLGLNRLISFFIGLSYGYMTFLLPRAGHVGFIASIFLFPWFYLMLISFVKSKHINHKILSSIGIAFFFTLSFWFNMYYFIILLLSLLFLSFYFFIIERKKLLESLLNNWLYLLLIVTIIIIFLFPTLTTFYEMSMFSEAPKPLGWAGAIDFSSDFFGFFVPSIYNYYYGKIVTFLIKDIEFAKGIFENFTYPGIIILLSYFFLILYLKKLSKQLKNIFVPYFATSIAFLILTLGPFLHIFGRWTLNLEGVPVVFPLPFIFLHYVPFLGNIRAPGRLIVGFIFFAYIVCAYIIEFFLKNKSNKFKIVFFFIFFVLIVIDQRPMILPLVPINQEQNKIFKIVGDDFVKSSLLEIPFSVRDGLTYFGDYSAVSLTFKEPIHKKSIIGGYAGRIPDYIKEYYHQNPFIGYLGRIIDGDISINPYMMGTDLTIWKTLNKNESLKTIDFLDIKYIVVNDDKSYLSQINAVLKDLGYERRIKENNLSLWEKKLEQKEFKEINLKESGDNVFLGLGWYPIENDFRWVDKKSSVMFKIQTPRKYTLKLRMAAFNEDQNMTIYLNKKKVAKINISGAMREYSVPINLKFEKGINTIYFIFEKYYIPSKVIQGSLDERKLSAKFNKIWLTNQK